MTDLATIAAECHRRKWEIKRVENTIGCTDVLLVGGGGRDITADAEALRQYLDAAPDMAVRLNQTAPLHAEIVGRLMRCLGYSEGRLPPVKLLESFTRIVGGDDVDLG